MSETFSHRPPESVDSSKGSVLKKARKALSSKISGIKEDMDMPQFPAYANLTLPEGIQTLDAAYAIKLGILANKGFLFKIVETGTPEQVHLDEIPTEEIVELSKNRFILTPSTIKNIVGKKAIATMEQKQAQAQEKEMQLWFQKSIEVWRDREKTPYVLNTSEGRFPTNMNGVDDAWNSLELPRFERSNSHGKPNSQSINVDHPHPSLKNI